MPRHEPSLAEIEIGEFIAWATGELSKLPEKRRLELGIKAIESGSWKDEPESQEELQRLREQLANLENKNK